MADPDRSERVTTTTTTSGSTGIGIILGGLVVAVAVLAYFMFANGSAPGSDSVNIKIEGAGDAIEGAAEAVEGTAEGN
ncbi:hypothetical protein [Roseovarius sp. D0-M9]|uniref:hypothetical protein n=1 Tax=Roseovarius sp. D0-M9 TaxID=3127117 RepID=UPI00300FACF7